MAIAEIYITLKPGLFDAQGNAVTNALHQLGYAGVKSVRIGKYMAVEVDDSVPVGQLSAQLERMCRQLLANPVIENFEITLDAAPLATGVPVAAQSEPVAVVAPPSALSPSEQIAAGAISTSSAATPDPFAMGYAQYNALPPSDRMAMQEVAWTKHGALILQALNERRASWVLMQNGQVLDAGATMDTYPSSARLEALGTSNDLVPWVFTRAT